MIEAGQVSASVAAFLDEKMPAIVATRRKNGAVKMTPAWYEFRDGYVWLNSWRGAHWLSQIERDQQATLLFIDPQDMYRLVHVEAQLLQTTTEGAGEHIDRLSQRYRGERYRSPFPQQRVIVQLKPQAIRSSLESRRRTSS